MRQIFGEIAIAVPLLANEAFHEKFPGAVRSPDEGTGGHVSESQRFADLFQVLEF